MGDLLQRRKAMAEEMMRDAICDAAAAVLAEVGFTALTMERVAEAAGVAKGTLYNYFKDKDALVLEVIDRTFTPLTDAIDRVLAPGDDPQRTLTEVIRLILVGVDERRALGQALCASELTPYLAAGLREKQLRLRRKLSGVFRQAQASGRLDPACSDPEALGRFLSVLLDGVIEERMLHGSECPAVDQEVRSIADHVLRPWFREAR